VPARHFRKAAQSKRWPNQWAGLLVLRARASTIKISLATPKLSRFFRNFAAAVDMLNVPMPPLVGQQPGLLDWRCVEVNANFLEVKTARRSF